MSPHSITLLYCRMSFYFNLFFVIKIFSPLCQLPILRSIKFLSVPVKSLLGFYFLISKSFTYKIPMVKNELASNIKLTQYETKLKNRVKQTTAWQKWHTINIQIAEND